MRNKVIVLMIIATSVVLAGCSSKKEVSQDTGEIKVETIQNESVSAETSTPTPTPTPTPEPTPTLQELVTVVCTNKTNVPADYMNGRYSDRCDLTFDLTNNTDKPIQGIQGLLIIDDLFGSNITKITCNFTGQIINPGETVENDEMGKEINEFVDTDVKIWNENYEDLKFSYLVNSVVYAGESSDDDTNKTSGSKDVTITCTGKKNIEIDIYAGRFNPNVQFFFTIENHTDKDIRGIQGIVTVSDLFGDVIDRFNCDFTGTTIKAGDQAEISDKYLEVPSYDDAAVQLYNEDFEDLKFEYEVKDIVYSE